MREPRKNHPPRKLLRFSRANFPRRKRVGKIGSEKRRDGQGNGGEDRRRGRGGEGGAGEGEEGVPKKGRDWGKIGRGRGGKGTHFVAQRFHLAFRELCALVQLFYPLVKLLGRRFIFHRGSRMCWGVPGR